ncbi:MAG: AarF/ABC1/UbiB kinase family protein, partial [Acidimicrobiaceae bacterium]|nr:AarF/ABC1/UbiB kinase family protein [Acidimicrobiaceae bacterium]
RNDRDSTPRPTAARRTDVVVLGRNQMPVSRVSRSVRLAGLAGRTVANRAQTAVRSRVGGEGAEAAERASEARLAERYAEVLGNMKGAIMKVGQILSFVDAPGLLPVGGGDLFQSTLSRLQDDVPPLSPDEVAGVIEHELGARPDQIFAYFSAQPIAAASIGQVHRARLADGTDLAIKVQYPGVADSVRADLANTGLLASAIKTGMRLLGSDIPDIDPKMVVEEIGERVVEELDYRIEAANQQEFHSRYEGHPFIHIPAVHPEFSTGRVLAMEYVDAKRWSDATAAGEEVRSRWGETIFRFVFASLHRYGLFNADPHPGNYLFHEDGSVTFLDFGCVKRFASERVSAMSGLVDAALANNANGVLRSFIDVGLLDDDDTEGLDPGRLLEYYRTALRDRWDEQPFTYTPESVAEIVANTYRPLGPWSDVTRRIRMPKDLLFLNRITIGASSVLGRLRASADWKSIDDEIRHDGPPATELGRLEADWRVRRSATASLPRSA